MLGCEVRQGFKKKEKLENKIYGKRNKKEGDWKNFSDGVSQRPKQPLQLKRTFREAGLLTKDNYTSLDSVSLPQSGIPFRRQ